MNLNSLVTSFKSGAAQANPISSDVSTVKSYIDNIKIPITGTGTVVTDTETVISTLTIENISDTVYVGQAVVSDTGSTGELDTNTTITSQVTPLLVNETIGGIGRYILSTAAVADGGIVISIRPPTISISLLDSIVVTLNGIESQMSTFVSGTSVSLPLMKAVDNLEKTLTVSQGIIPAGGGGSAFTTAFAPLDDVKALIISLYNTIMTNRAGITTGNATSIANVNNAHSTLISASASSFSAASAIQTSSISTLKAFAQVMFNASVQPAHVLAVLGKTIAIHPSPAAVAMDTAAAQSVSPSSPAYATAMPVTKLSPTTGDNVKTPPPPIVNAPVSRLDTMCGIGYDAFKASYIAVLADAITACEVAYDEQDALRGQVEAWRNIRFVNPTYTQIKDQATSNPGDAAAQLAYANAKNIVHTQCSTWPMFTAALETHTTNVDRVDHLKNQWKRWVAAADARYNSGITDGSSGDGIFVCDQNLW